jgi:hypothetical protein
MSNKDIDENSTKYVLDHHWEAFVNNDLEEVMKDFNSVCISKRLNSGTVIS